MQVLHKREFPEPQAPLIGPLASGPPMGGAPGAIGLPAASWGLAMNLAHVASYLRSPRVSRWRKLLGFVALAYVVLPADLVPDLVPVLGWLDDVGVVAAAFAFLSRDLKRHAAQVPAAETVVEGEVLSAR